jgi:hypothetical protein
VVEPVIAEIGGDDRMPFGPVVEVLLRQPCEVTISFAAHGPSSPLVSPSRLTVTLVT